MTQRTYRAWVGEQTARQTLPPFWRKVYELYVKYNLGIVTGFIGYGIALWCMYDVMNDVAETPLPLSFILAIVIVAALVVAFVTSLGTWARYEQAFSDMLTDESEEGYRRYCTYLEQMPESVWPATTIANLGGPSRDELLAIAGYGPAHRMFSRHRVAFGLAGLAVLVSGPVARQVFNIVTNTGLVMVSLMIGLMMLMTTFLLAPREDDVVRARVMWAIHLSWEKRYGAQRTLPV